MGKDVAMTPLSDASRSAFDQFVHRGDAPMLIATVAVGEAPHVERSGCLVGFATQCSIEPRRFLVCLSVANHTTALAARAELVGVHAVPADRFDLAQRFGGETGDDVGIDKFAGVSWSEGPQGVPVLDDCPDRFVGRVLDRTPLGDHVGYLLEPVQAQVGPSDRYLRLDAAEEITPGHPT